MTRFLSLALCVVWSGGAIAQGSIEIDGTLDVPWPPPDHAPTPPVQPPSPALPKPKSAPSDQPVVSEAKCDEFAKANNFAEAYQCYFTIRKQKAGDASDRITEKAAKTLVQAYAGKNQRNPFAADDKNSTPPPTHPQFCIDAQTLPHQTAWSVTNMKNTCDGAVTFDYDDCGQNPDLQQECTVKTASISGHDSLRIDNYKKVPVPRNFR